MQKTKLFLATSSITLALLGCDPKSAESIEGSVAEEQMAMAEADQRSSPLEKVAGEINGKKISIQYGAPSVKNRELWGDLVPYNVVWRTGANEATFIEVTEEIQIEGKSLAVGKYSIFTIPKEKQAWTVIFNSDWDLEHGHFQYNEKNDVLRVDVQPQFVGESQEVLAFEIADPGIVLKWGKVLLPISVQ